MCHMLCVCVYKNITSSYSNTPTVPVVELYQLGSLATQPAGLPWELLVEYWPKTLVVCGFKSRLKQLSDFLTICLGHMPQPLFSI